MATEYFHLGMGEWTESESESTSWNQYYMSRIATKAELSGRHSARKTTVQKLCRSNITDSMVMQVTGHKNIQSLNAYKKPFLEQQEQLSHIICNYQANQSTSTAIHSQQSAISLSNSTFNSSFNVIMKLNLRILN